MRILLGACLLRFPLSTGCSAGLSVCSLWQVLYALLATAVWLLPFIQANGTYFVRVVIWAMDQSDVGTSALLGGVM